ncbi:GNAT family N-acetyltransferase [Evansella cellulosilytica]|uniref:GNAT family N-acetyltransferase n=1 Tax=Evansella cellulosilytica TaxID=1413 RepID=UPI0002F904F5|nr:N-acetyltransferase [Evansella cellulosilytica]
MAHISHKYFETKRKQRVLLRTATANDGLGMHTLTKEVLFEEKGLVMTIKDFTMTVEEQAQQNEWYLQLPHTLTLVAEHNHIIIGILTIEPEIFLKTAHRCNIGLIIKEEFRSLQIGWALMNTAISWAKNTPYYEKIELEVLSSNHAAIKLYERLGFQIEGTVNNAIKHRDDHYENLHRMGLSL